MEHGKIVNREKSQRFCLLAFFSFKMQKIDSLRRETIDILNATMGAFNAQQQTSKTESIIQTKQKFTF